MKKKNPSSDLTTTFLRLCVTNADTRSNTLRFYFKISELCFITDPKAAIIQYGHYPLMKIFRDKVAPTVRPKPTIVYLQHLIKDIGEK